MTMHDYLEGPAHWTDDAPKLHTCERGNGDYDYEREEGQFKQCQGCDEYLCATHWHEGDEPATDDLCSACVEADRDRQAEAQARAEYNR